MIVIELYVHEVFDGVLIHLPAQLYVLSSEWKKSLSVFKLEQEYAGDGVTIIPSWSDR